MVQVSISYNYITSCTFLCLGSYQEVPAKSACVEAALRQILSQAELLLPKMEDVRAEMMGDLVEEEMQQTAKAIEEAAAKIAVCCLVDAYRFSFCYTLSSVCCCRSACSTSSCMLIYSINISFAAGNVGKLAGNVLRHSVGSE